MIGSSIVAADLAELLGPPGGGRGAGVAGRRGWSVVLMRPIVQRASGATDRDRLTVGHL